MIINSNKANKAVLSWHQDPLLTRQYLQEVGYDPEDYSVSYIGDYAPQIQDYNNSYPIRKSADGVTYENETPRQRNPFSSTTIAGDVVPLDQVRWINTNIHDEPDGDPSSFDTMNFAKNVRDIGGWPCDGGTIKYGKFIRGGQCHPKDREVLVEHCGIKAELNLRRISECIEQEISITDSILGPEVDFCITDGKPQYSIKPDTIESWKKLLRFIFDSIKKDRPVYCHCQAGADRTGTVAAMVEAILGVSQPNIDKDYELTCFAVGVQSGNTGRRRNTTNWGYRPEGSIVTPYIWQITQLQRGSTFRDKVLYWVASLGFTVDEINEFRQAMINGTPQTIMLDLDNYEVNKSLINVTTTSTVTQVVEHQPLILDLTANRNYIINSIEVIMGGATLPISTIYTGQLINIDRYITYTLNHCTSNNNRETVLDGQSFGAKITPDTNYTLEGATVSIIMGGVDVSNYYSNGNIVIPEVTGNIYITVSAVYVPPVNLYTGRNANYPVNYRIRTEGPDSTGGTGCYISNFIPADCSNGVLIARCSPMNPKDSSNQQYPYIERAAFYNSNYELITWSSGGTTQYATPYTNNANGNLKVEIDNNDILIYLGQLVEAGQAPYLSDIRYVIFDIRPLSNMPTLTDADVLTPSQLSITIEG